MGTLVFTASSAASIPPWIWPPVIMLCWPLVFLKTNWRKMIYMACGLIFVALAFGPYPSIWSPYYYVQYSQEKIGLRVWVNSSFHQLCLDYGSNLPENRDMQKIMIGKWARPYHMYKEINGRYPKKVLILGAGTGNDANIARFGNAAEIVCVEIDPAILELGHRYNSLQAYSDPRVRTVVDDARHFLRTSSEKFDMVVFGTLDSQALLSSQANLRLESYVYTTQAFKDAKALLNDGGLVVLYYSVLKPWLLERIDATMKSAFGENRLIQFESNQFLYNTLAVGSDENTLLRFKGVKTRGDQIPTTDDWPFIFLERPTIARVYRELFLFVSLCIFLVFLTLRRIHKKTGLYANFWLLGLGFTLMESSAIVRLSLLFGSTWVVNAVVFSSVLFTIFLANLVVMKKHAPPLSWCFGVLIALVGLNWALSLSWLMSLSYAGRVAASGFLIGAPVFFAALCFSRLFEKEPVTGYPLGINLVGAMAGGTLEYASMAFGLRSVWLIILAVYSLAALATLVIERRKSAGA